MRYKILPVKSCRICHGSGEIMESVEVWGYNTMMPNGLCDCVIDQLPENFNDKEDEVEIVYERENDLDDYFFDLEKDDWTLNNYDLD